MGYSALDASEFLRYFKSNPEAYGVTTTGEMVDGKMKSESSLVYGSVTSSILIRHLNGENGIGLSPVLPNGNCNWGAIDIDNYSYNLDDIVKAIYDFNMPLVPCWSKSHKLHIYIFFEDETPLETCIELLSWYRDAFACGKKTEIFPKQRKVSEQNKFYSWINLPYFDADNEANWRKVVGRNGELYSLPDALERMKECQLSVKEHRYKIEEIPYFDAPPCIRTGALLRDVGPGQRNNWLFSAGVYLRLKDEQCDLESALTELNNSLHQPIDDRELHVTILQGFQRKSYFYMCNAMERCDKVLCRHEKYGIESKDSSGLEYGTLTQVATDPPYYEWEISGQMLRFQSEEEILGQNKFRALCLRQLHLVPRVVPNDRWTAILNRACDNIVIKKVDEQIGDFTAGSAFLGLIQNYFYKTRRADNKTQLGIGRVWEDKETEEFVFSAASIVDFIKNKNGMSMKPVEIRIRLEDIGAVKEGLYWRVSKNCIPEPDNTKVEINFKLREGEEDTDAF